MKRLTNIILITALLLPYQALATIPANQKAKVIRAYLNGDKDLQKPDEVKELDFDGDGAVTENDYRLASDGKPLPDLDSNFDGANVAGIPQAQGAGDGISWPLVGAVGLAGLGIVLSQKPSTNTAGGTTPTAGTAPTGFAGVAGNAQVILNWAATANIQYNLYQSTNPAILGTKLAGIGQPPFTLTGLVNGTTYYFGLTSTVGGQESAVSNIVQLTPAAVAASATVTAVTGTFTVGQQLDIQGTALTGATTITVNGINAIYTASGTGYAVTIPAGASKITGTAISITLGGTPLIWSNAAQNIAPAVLTNWSTGWSGTGELDMNATTIIEATPNGNVLQAQLSNGIVSIIDVVAPPTTTFYYPFNQTGCSWFATYTQPSSTAVTITSPVAKKVIAFYSSKGIVKSVSNDYGVQPLSKATWAMASCPNGTGTYPTQPSYSSPVNATIGQNMIYDEADIVVFNPTLSSSNNTWVSVLYNPVGNVYYRLWDNMTIDKYDMSVNPATTTAITAPPAGSTKLYFDNAGNLTVLTATGIQKLIGGTTWTPFSNFVTTSFCPNADGSAYVLDTATKAVRLLDVNGNVAGAVIYTSVNGIPPDMKEMAGNLYVLETNGTITKITF